MMIGDKTVLEYVAQVAIYAQPFLWMWLYGSRIRLIEHLKYLFYVAGVTCIVVVWVKGVEFGFYRTYLLMLYMAMTMAAVGVLNVRMCFKDSLCLGFLLVYLNSYYWELPLHIVEAAVMFPLVRMFVQGWHLVPVPFLLRNYVISRAHWWTLLDGLRFSAYGITLIWILTYFSLLPTGFKVAGYIVVRVVCLFHLVKVFAEAQPRLRHGPVAVD